MFTQKKKSQPPQVAIKGGNEESRKKVLSFFLFYMENIESVITLSGSGITPGILEPKSRVCILEMSESWFG